MEVNEEKNWSKINKKHSTINLPLNRMVWNSSVSLAGFRRVFTGSFGSVKSIVSSIFLE